MIVRVSESTTIMPETVASVRAEMDLVVTTLRGQVVDLTKKLEAALYRMDQMSRQIFGRSREQYDHPDQQRIDLGALTPGAPAGPVTVIPPEAKAVVPGKESCAGRAKRKPIPDGLEVVDLPLRTLSEAERLLPDGRVLIPCGERTSERLHFVAARFQKIVEHVAVYGLPDEPALQVVTPCAPQIIAQGIPTTELVVQVCYAKYGLHLPLHRQMLDYTRYGVAIAKSTMCGWLAALNVLLDPVYQAVRQQVLASHLIFSDDIPIDMLDPQTEGGSITARFWSYRGSDQVLFAFTLDRCGDHPSQMLEHYHGALMADALPGYRKIVTTNGIWRLGCWAHVRRKFFEARKTDPRCGTIILLIRKLYAAERRADQRAVIGHAHDRWRWRLRQRYSVRILAQIKSHLKAWDPATLTATSALPDSPLGKAIHYPLAQWELLERFASTGDWPIDNNPAENAQRPIAVGRKNHLFMGSEGGGEMAATFYTLIQSCRIHNLNAVAYLEDICRRLLNNDRQFHAMTPKAWATAHAPSSLT